MKIANDSVKFQEVAAPLAPVVPDLATPGTDGLANQPAGGDSPARVSFARKVVEAVEAVSGQQGEANKMVIDLATGKDVNLHNAVIAMEEAGLSFRFLVQVRNKALEAYQEVMRTQV